MDFLFKKYLSKRQFPEEGQYLQNLHWKQNQTQQFSGILTPRTQVVSSNQTVFFFFFFCVYKFIVRK